VKTTWRSELHSLTGSYAVDALDGPELTAFEHHLTRCGPCAIEVRGLRETAACLALATARQPPAAMQQRVLAATYRTRQLPPLTSPEHRRAARRIPLPRLPLTITAACAAALALTLAIIQISAGQQLSSAQAHNSAIAAVLAAPDVRIAAASTANGATITVIASAARHEALISTTGMPPLPGGKVYQAWVMAPAEARSAGLLQTVSGAPTNPLVVTGTHPGEKIGITIEPAGGTSHPTTTPLTTVPVPA
jgi:hypothetical protein